MTISLLDPVNLALGLFAFVLIARVGAVNRRIGGVLLTFPILNGVALLASEAPFAVAGTIAVIVILNSLLFWSAATWVERLPPLPEGLGDIPRMLARLALWAAIWAAAAFALTAHRGLLPSEWALFAIHVCVAAACIHWLWRGAPPASPAAVPPSPAEAAINWTVRLLLFVVVFAILMLTARTVPDPRWTGMASALPLPGLFALAYLSTRTDGRSLRPIRDTVLLGPLLVIPFNHLFALVVVRLPSGTAGTVAGMAALLMFWGVALALVFLLVPLMERRLDRRRPAAFGDR
jgi:uncharacterized membrane protein YtjA (UPF0391 family)